MSNKIKYFSYFSFFVICVNTIYALPSDEIWNKAMEYYKEGKMLIFDKKHFIFDEYNYTKLDINDTKMLDLYKKQDNIFFNYNISTFIFIVKFINETEEYLNYTFIANINKKLKQLGYDINYIIFTVTSIERKRVLIYIGNKTKINNNSCYTVKSIENNLLHFISLKKYYKAWEFFLNEIIWCCDDYFDGKLFKSSKSAGVYQSVKEIVNNNSKIFILIISLIILLFTIIVSIKLFKCYKKKSSHNNGENINAPGSSYNNNINNTPEGNNIVGNINKNNVDINHK